MIQAQIAGDDVGAAVVIEISHGQRIPAAAHGSEADRFRHVTESGAFVPEEVQGHPLTRRNQIQAAVPVEIDPDCGGDHPEGTSQLGTQ